MKERFLFYIYLLVFIPLGLSLALAVSDGHPERIILSIVTALLYLSPILVEKLSKLCIPPLLKYIFIGFVFIALYLGGVIDLYESIGYWDKIIHFSSGFVFTTISLSMLPLLSGNRFSLRQLKSGFIMIVIMTFSTFIALFFEFAEFAVDNLFNSTFQHNSNLFLSKKDPWLWDTMIDLLTAQVSTVMMSLYYKYLIQKDKWLMLEKILVRFK